MSGQSRPLPLLGWDLAAWRLAEADPSLRSTVVGIMCIEGRVELAELLPKISQAVATNRVLRSCVLDDGAGPSLQEIAHFRVEDCVTQKASGESVAQVALELSALNFDAHLPLWRLAVVPTPTFTYVVAALHHAIADGNGALGLAAYLFDEYIAESAKPAQDADQSSSRTASAGSGLAAAGAKVLERAVRDPQGLARDLNGLLKSFASLLAVPTSVHAQAMTRRSADFGAVYFRFPKSTVRAAISGRGVSQHDALVASVSRALFLYHQRLGIELRQLRLNVPVALNVESAAANQLVVARLEIDLSDASPAHLMAESNARLHQWRSEPALALAAELIEASRLLPTGVLASVVKKADATISSLRGVPRLGNISGHPVSGIWPLVAPVGAAVSVTSVGVGAEITMCVTHDIAAVSDASLWTQCLTRAMSDVAGVTLIEHKFE